MAKQYHGEIHYRRLVWIERVETFDNQDELNKRFVQLVKSDNIKDLNVVDNID